MIHFEIEPREAALKQLILQAGESALRGFNSRQPGEYQLKGHQDILTETDTLVEAQLIEAISARFPQDLILGEESAQPPADAQSLWVIDPIDGTANFARGIAHFCICIAWLRHGVTELGAIYNPVSQELYLARRGHYALKNDRPLRCAATDDSRRAAFELGWSSRHSQRRYLDVMAALLNGGATVRRGGSGALALAWVAEGRSDGYVEAHMNAWDCLAGLLLVAEAGGRIGVVPEDAAGIYAGLPVLAAAPGVAAALAQASAIALAERATLDLRAEKHNDNVSVAGSEATLSTTTLSPDATNTCGSPTSQQTAADHPSTEGPNALSNAASQAAAARNYPRPPISLIAADLPGWGVDIYIGGADGVTDLALLDQHNIRTVINCAVNLDIDWVNAAEPGSAAHLLRHGSGSLRYYKLGLIDGEGNAPEMLHAGYLLMRSALLQQIPDKASYRNRERGNILVNCRGGRSRSVALVALFLHLECPQQFPTLDAAIALIRDKRQLHPDEWFETPKPSLIEMAQTAIAREQALRATERPDGRA